MILPLLFLCLLPEGHVAGKHVDVFGEEAALAPAVARADGVADGFRNWIGAEPIRGAVVILPAGEKATDERKRDRKYLANGAKWVWCWETGKKEPEGMFEHELAHLWLIFHVDGVDRKAPAPYGSLLPDWMDEGFAGQFDTEETRNEFRKALRDRAEREGLIPLETFFGLVHPDVKGEKDPRKRPASRYLFYSQSYGVVAFLGETYGVRGFRHVLETLKRGREISAVLGKEGLPASMEELEVAWKEWACR